MCISSFESSVCVLYEYEIRIKNDGLKKYSKFKNVLSKNRIETKKAKSCLKENKQFNFFGKDLAH